MVVASAVPTAYLVADEVPNPDSTRADDASGGGGWEGGGHVLVWGCGKDLRDRSGLRLRAETPSVT